MSQTTTLNPAGPTNTRILSSTPKEIYTYPSATHTIHLGNGGAGPSGIFRALAKDYQAAYPNTASAVAWYQNISPLTLQALRDGGVDISLTYERDQEADAVKNGYAQGPPELIFNDHFMLAGPANNPAGIEEQDGPHSAFEKIARFAQSNPGRRLFLSRNDDSATNLKERAIWQGIGVMVDRDALPDWYVGTNIFPADALRQADAESLYVLVDHGTFGMLQKELQGTESYVLGGDLLRNPCNALLSRKADERVKLFLEYLKSARGQDVIARFGEELYGTALYTPAAQLDF